MRVLGLLDRFAMSFQFLNYSSINVSPLPRIRGIPVPIINIPVGGIGGSGGISTDSR